MPFDKEQHLRIEKIEPWEDGYENGEEYRLLSHLTYYWTRSDRVFTSSPGAKNNGASILRLIPDIIVDDHGKIDKPVVIHDDLYWAYCDATKRQRDAFERVHCKWTKSEADAMLRDGCIDEGISPAKAWLIWSAVRMNLLASYKWGRNK